jgi:hypothetical protein
MTGSLLVLVPQKPPKRFVHCVLCGSTLGESTSAVMHGTSRVGFACATCSAAPEAELITRIRTFADALSACSSLLRRLIRHKPKPYTVH